jgi:hypothetical protein
MRSGGRSSVELVVGHEHSESARNSLMILTDALFRS